MIRRSSRHNRTPLAPGQSMVFLIAFDIFEFFSWIKMRKECLAAESNCMELSFRSNEKRLTKCPQPPTRVDSPLSKQLRNTLVRGNESIGRSVEEDLLFLIIPESNLFYRDTKSPERLPSPS
jgi:hypothetical protein